MKNKEKCVVCGAATPYTKNTHIDSRQYYVEGAGQLCKVCWDKTYTQKDKVYITGPFRTRSKVFWEPASSIEQTIQTFLDEHQSINIRDIKQSVYTSQANTTMVVYTIIYMEE